MRTSFSVLKSDCIFFCKDPKPESVEPLRGPAAGGTVVTIKGEDLDTGTKEDVSVSVGGVHCEVYVTPVHKHGEFGTWALTLLPASFSTAWRLVKRSPVRLENTAVRRFPLTCSQWRSNMERTPPKTSQQPISTQKIQRSQTTTLKPASCGKYGLNWMLRGFLIFLFYTHRQTADEHRERENQNLFTLISFFIQFFIGVLAYILSHYLG